MVYKARKIRAITVAIIMKTIALLLSTLALATATIVWDDLLATWRLPSSDPERLNSFFSLPRTRSDAVSAGWVDAHVKQSLRVDTYCLPGDSRVCVLLDACGYIAGLQIGELLSDVKTPQRIYNMEQTNYYQIKTMFNQRVSTSVVWTRNPMALRNPRSSFGRWNGLTGTEGVWFEIHNGTYAQIPRNLENLDPLWTQQSCVPSMGTHYYYNMYNTTACEDLPPWVLLFRNETLAGVGHQVFGNGSVVDRDWKDVITIDGIRMVIPNGPQCLYDDSVAYGLLSTHVFFTSKPWNMTCT